MSALAQRSPQERLWIVGGALVALVVTLIGWLLFISPQRSETDDVNAQAAAVRATNTDWESKISTLREQSKDMTGVRKSLLAAQQALPGTSGVPDFLRSLQSLGSATGADVVSLSVGQPADVSSVVNGQATPATGSSTPPAGTTTAPVKGGVFGLTISAQVNGAPDKLTAFLKRLQTVQPRAVLITHITEGGTDSSNGTSLQLTMQAFVAPSSAAEQTQLSQAAGR